MFDFIVKIGKTAFVALALFAVIAIGVGSGLNQLISGLGNLLLGFGIIAFIIIVIIVALTVYSFFQP